MLAVDGVVAVGSFVVVVVVAAAAAASEMFADSDAVCVDAKELVLQCWFRYYCDYDSTLLLPQHIVPP